MMKNVIILLFLVIGFASCTKEKIQIPKPVVNDNVKFSTDVYPIFASYSCTGCHGTSGGLTLSGSSSEVVSNLLSSGAVVASDANASKLFTYFSGASHNGKTLTAQEVANIEGWINQGAQDN